MLKRLQNLDSKLDNRSLDDLCLALTKNTLKIVSQKIVTNIYVSVMRLDGSMPIKYGLRLSVDEKYKALKKHISILTSLPVTQILLVEIIGALVKVSI